MVRVQTLHRGSWENAWRNMTASRALDMQQELEYKSGIAARVIWVR